MIAIPKPRRSYLTKCRHIDETILLEERQIGLIHKDYPSLFKVLSAGREPINGKRIVQYTVGAISLSHVPGILGSYGRDTAPTLLVLSTPR